MAENDEQSLDQTRQYIQEKLNALFENIGAGYGEPLMAELIQRLERTIGEFHEEVQELVEELKSNSKERRKKLKELMKSATTKPIPEMEQEVPPEVSDFERRLESRHGKGADETEPEKAEPKPEKKETAKKRSFFGRKKKK